MQTITEIGRDETLRVSGVYHYHLGGKDKHIREPWTIHEKSDGTRITRVERDASFFKANLLTEIVTSAGKFRELIFAGKMVMKNWCQKPQRPIFLMAMICRLAVFAMENHL